MSRVIRLPKPDDMHHHLRDGEVLASVVAHAHHQFHRVVAMPNIKPPVRTLKDASEYKDRIEQCLPPCASSTEPAMRLLMTLYLTDVTTAEDVIEAKQSGLVYGVKLYPAGATTNSEYGVTDINKVKHVLQAMSDINLPLLVHGEVVDKAVDVFDKEKVFIETILKPLLIEFPKLKVVMEHITTADAAEFVSNYPGNNLAATITCHHLLYNRNDIFKGGICPHMYCLPILKRERHREALLAAAVSGNPKFFLGTDSAPHAIEAKESGCGCAGLFTSHAAIELYAEAFDSVNCLDRLENFASVYGAQFYGLEPNTTSYITLVNEPWVVPEKYQFGSSNVKPLRAGESILWKISE